ncbi:MAG TPA: hypothetical protein VKP11_02895, partial [Frankiaceae bacterium]|nr:hypothetical protein [Frankiaceae bacterium]
MTELARPEANERADTLRYTHVLTDRSTGLVRRHPVFCVVLGVAALLRLLAFVAYLPALEFTGDSYSYLTEARTGVPNPFRPYGYSLFLKLLGATGALWVVPAVQHLMGLGLGIALYAFLLRRGLPRGLAVVGAAPVLLDAYQVDVEQFVLSETLVAVLLLGGLLTLLWRPVPAVAGCGLAGLLLAAATLTRTVALGVGALALGYLVVRRLGVRRVAAFTLAFGLPLLAYAGWFRAERGPFSLQAGSGLFLYGRVAPFAECSKVSGLSPRQYVLCSPHPPSERPGSNWYVWDRASPRYRLGPLPEANRILADFAEKVVVAQPGDYATMIAGDLAHYVAPGRWVGRRDFYLGSWRFPNGSEQARWNVGQSLVGFDGQRLERRYSRPLAVVLRGYQRQGFTPGPLLALMAAVGVAAAVAWPRRGGWRARQDCLLLVASGAALLAMPAATAVFDYRYLLPTLLVLPPAAALGAHRLRLAWGQDRDRDRGGAPRAAAAAAGS